MTACGYEHEDGAYVLGALSPEDRLAFERHLPDCPDCARSVREFAGLPGLLARVPVGILDPEHPTTPVPETLLPGLVRRARQERRRRTWITGALAAASIAGAVALGGGVVATIDHNNASPSASPSTAAARQLHVVVAGPLSGWVSLTGVAWGTRLDLTCAYADTPSAYPDRSAPTYLLDVVHADGTVEQVASWKAIPGKSVHLAAATAATAGEIADVEVRTSSGLTVLKLS